MKKILVTTDFSKRSKAAMRFAIQLAIQTECEITFFHSYQVPRPSGWSEQVFTSFESKESAKIKKKLNTFVVNVYKQLKIEAVGAWHCVAEQAPRPADHIISFAKQQGFGYICISGRGAGKTSLWFGSNTAKLIKKSETPVIAVPSTYRRTKIDSICYASDLSDLHYELKQVTTFNSSLNASMWLLHLNTPYDSIYTERKRQSLDRQLNQYHMSMYSETFDYQKPLIVNINKIVKKRRPSILIMFTRQRKSILGKLLMSSISAEFASISKIPLLVFKKAINSEHSV